jgi:hypothetical protein
MKKIIFLLLSLFVMSCSQPTSQNTNTGTPTGPITASIGSTITVSGITVLFQKAYYLTNDPMYVQKPNRIGIDVKIGNTTASAVGYASIFSWGDLLTNLGEQCNATLYMSVNNDNYFSGSQILPGATITDTLSFSAYTGSPISAKLIGKIPFDDTPDFELSFLISEIGTKAPTH